jgi:serine/threonine-protein kinase
VTVYDIHSGVTIAGRYKVVGPHRQGGLSTAFEVVDSEDGSRRELQLFPHGLFDAEEQIEDFRGMLEPWTRVHSDAVLAVRAVVPLEPAGLALVTDFPDGESLRERMKGARPLDEAGVVRMGCQLLTGLGAIHAEGLVHGDVKPYTIHLDEGEATLGEPGAERAYLVDGGFTPGLWSAKHLGDKTALIGTPYYAPVEQFGGDAPNVQSDVYNVAAVLFECLAGTLPWKGKSFLEVFQAKLDKRPPSIARVAPDRKVDPALESVIAKGCCADRKERYQDAGDFLEALSALSANREE